MHNLISMYNHDISPLLRFQGIAWVEIHWPVVEKCSNHIRIRLSGSDSPFDSHTRNTYVQGGTTIAHVCTSFSLMIL